jgi:hypothetical protein
MELPYVIPEPNQPLRLAADWPVALSVDGRETAGTASVALEFLPVPRIAFDIALPAVSRSFDLDKVGTVLNLPQWQTSAEVRPASVQFSTKCPPSLRVLGIHPIGFGNASEKVLSTASFLLVNFPDFLGTGAVVHKEGNHSERLDTLVLQAHPWQIRLQLLPKCRERIKAVKAFSGYAVTHVGEVARLDRQLFSGKETQTLLDVVGRFLSFSVGRKCGLLLPIGFDSQRNVVWRQWWTDLFDPWVARRAWFDGSKGALLEAAFGGYARKQAQPIWTRPLGDAIYWYLLANNSLAGIDSGIILAQTALELLAWNYLVKDKAALSKTKFEELKAAGRIDRLLGDLAIGNTLPPASLARIRAHVADAPDDIAHLVVMVRNAIVHPTGEKIDHYLEIIRDVWTLALWTIEMVLLRLIDYSGEYLNRLHSGWVGTYDRVPWG